MRNEIRQALRDCQNLFGEEAFTNPVKFRAKLLDVLPGAPNELARNLLHNAIGGMNVYTRLKTSSSGNMGTDVYNLTREMNRKHGTSEDMAQVTIECIAELLGYVPPTLTSGNTSQPGAVLHIAAPTDSQPISVPTVASLFDSGQINLEFSEWGEAVKHFNDALKINPRYAPAYIGKLCAELKTQKADLLTQHSKPLTKYINYKKAVSFADPAYRQVLDKYNQTIVDRISEENRLAQSRKHQEQERGEELKRKVGSVMKFGDHDWRILDVKQGKALLLSCDILKQMPYHASSVGISWEKCTLRQYLNSEFLNKFKQADKTRIARTRINNPNNLWYGVNGGNDTTDKVFILSIEEVDRYFGNSGDYLNKRRKDYDGSAKSSGWFLSNGYDKDRIAKYNDMAWWWLRSPGDNSYSAAGVGRLGYVVVYGNIVSASGGVRPALWLNMQSWGTWFKQKLYDLQIGGV